MRLNEPIEKEVLLALFRLNKRTGRIYWRNPSKYHKEKTGQEAGGPRRQQHNGKRYWVVRINGRAYKRGHIVFCMVHGYWPLPCVDHKNGDSLDDRPNNLRPATITQNAWNHKGRKRRIDLPMGVRVMASSGRYQARIAHNKRMLHLGTYDTPEAAANAYRDKRRELYGDYA